MFVDGLGLEWDSTSSSGTAPGREPVPHFRKQLQGFTLDGTVGTDFPQ